MKRKEIFNFLSPLLDQFYQFSFALLPDELEAEQLVIDGVNGFIVKERKWLTRSEAIIEGEGKMKRVIFQKIINHIYELALKRLVNFKVQREESFYQLPVRNRAIMVLRYQMNFAPEQVEDMLGLARWEVIEGIHNSRFMLMNELNAGTP